MDLRQFPYTTKKIEIQAFLFFTYLNRTAVGQTIKECITNGICKINVNTEISVYAVEKTKELLVTGSPHLAVVAEAQQKFVKEIVLKYMRFFGVDRL
jgi:fructose/tagatose bisphosphate aldolase